MYELRLKLIDLEGFIYMFVQFEPCLRSHSEANFASFSSIFLTSQQIGDDKDQASNHPPLEFMLSLPPRFLSSF